MIAGKIEQLITSFWYHKRFRIARSIIKITGFPITYSYYIGQFLISTYRSFFKYQSRLFVVCIGNITCGGEGKTPLTLHIARQLIVTNTYKKKNYLNDDLIADIKLYYSIFYSQELCNSDIQNACIITKGYRKKTSGTKNICNSIADEAVMLTKVTKTYIAKERVVAIKNAEIDNYSIAIMDDGYQNNSIYKNYNIMVFSLSRMLDNQTLLPFGPLRETWRSAVHRANAIVIIDDTYQESINLEKIHEYKDFIYKKSKINRHKYSSSVSFFYTKTNILNIDAILNLNCILITGIAYPEKVVAALLSCKCNIIEHFAFGDHHVFRDLEISKIAKNHAANNCAIVTTEKDHPRLMHAISNCKLLTAETTEKLMSSIRVVNIGLDNCKSLP